jgi:SAM-dependent methyltransferase
VAKPTVNDEELQRLEQERDRADAAYNDALTRVDRALVHPRPLPAPPPPPEHGLLPQLNRLWEVVPASHVPSGGWRGRLGAVVWRMLAPIFERQQEFNASLVQHLNAQTTNEQQAREVVVALVAAARQEFDALATFQAQLVQCLQQITLYVDTKDRHEGGRLRREQEDRAIALAAGIDAVSGEALRRWESLTIQSQRQDGRVATVAAAQEEIRTSVAGFHRTAEALTREIERLVSSHPDAGPAGGRREGEEAAASGAPDTTAFGDRLASQTYVGFEDAFRGSPEDIRSRLHEYVTLFSGASAVLDVGCGRGELLELLAANGITGRGVDLNHAMVERCRAAGLDVTESDAVTYLDAQPDESLGGMVAIQVVEHLQAAQLLRLLELSHRKLRPGSRVVLETINPACWYAFFSSFIRDITHVHPIHPDTLRYLLVASGYQRVEIQYREPFPDWNKLQVVRTDVLGAISPALGDMGEAFNENVQKLNALLFTYLDYAAIGEKV